ncbi:MAG: septation protein A [Alphaproteobacteria bacterium]|jgi:intracellular septation protein
MSKIKSAAPGWLRPATEYGPLLTFFIAFYSGGKDLITATGAFMVAVVLVILLLAVWRQKPPIMFIVTVVIVLFFGGLTLWFQDERFIKMKPTIVQSLFAIVLLGGLYFKRPLLKPLLQSAWPLQDRGWSVLSLRFALFFIVMAILNEIVWRNVSTEIWLNFKVFGIILLTFAFTACQFPVFTRYKIEDTNPENKTDQ